jgi:hypothetical protein
MAVMEDHTDPAPANVVNSIVKLSLDGTGQASVVTLASGKDFYSSPCLDVDTARLAYVAWDHPNMPWDRTPLYCQPLDPTTFHPVKMNPLVVHGHDTDGGLISVYAPQWYQGRLYFLSDETGYYNLYTWEGDGGPDNVPNNCQPLYAEKAGADFSESKCGWALGANEIFWTVALQCTLSQTEAVMMLQTPMMRWHRFLGGSLILKQKRCENLAAPVSHLHRLTR